MNKIVAGTRNAGKVREIRQALAELPFEVSGIPDEGLADVEETGVTFSENAILKARYYALHTGEYCLADDSGLCVDALGGAPGLYSARYAGGHGDSAANISRLLRELEGLEPEARTAHFHAVIVLLRHAADPQPLVAEGVWPGRVLDAPRGTGGFGYDPVFLDTGSGRSAAELEPALKNRISHRGRALAQLRERLPAALATLR